MPTYVLQLSGATNTINSRCSLQTPTCLVP